MGSGTLVTTIASEHSLLLHPVVSWIPPLEIMDTTLIRGITMQLVIRVRIRIRNTLLIPGGKLFKSRVLLPELKGKKYYVIGVQFAHSSGDSIVDGKEWL